MNKPALTFFVDIEQPLTQAQTLRLRLFEKEFIKLLEAHFDRVEMSLSNVETNGGRVSCFLKENTAAFQHFDVDDLVGRQITITNDGLTALAELIHNGILHTVDEVKAEALCLGPAVLSNISQEPDSENAPKSNNSDGCGGRI